MSQTVGKGMLIDAVKQLRVSWNRCQSSWNDENAKHFENEFLGHLDSAARQACDAMDRLQSACEEARRVCE